ncbi:hypothetical protein chiPu_0034004, partial [Chiloscyllium punctatum]|nr:hypothetical protein [Chiloscyllium punctatum]
VGIDPADVAGAQPAVTECFFGLLLVDVTGEHLRAPGQELADRRGPRPGVKLAALEDRKLDQRIAGADALGARPHAVHVVSDGAGELGHAVELLDAVAAPGREIAPLDLRRADRGAGGGDAQARNVAVGDRDVGERAERGRHVAGDVDAVCLDDFPEMGDQRRIARPG